MTLYSCECGKTMEIGKATIVYRDGEWVTKEALCECGKWMDSKPTDGMPNLKRTEPSLSKQRDNLWKGAKETLIGTRGVNEDY